MGREGGVRCLVVLGIFGTFLGDIGKGGEILGLNGSFFFLFWVFRWILVWPLDTVTDYDRHFAAICDYGPELRVDMDLGDV